MVDKIDTRFLYKEPNSFEQVKTPQQLCIDQWKKQFLKLSCKIEA